MEIIVFAEHKNTNGDWQWLWDKRYECNALCTIANPTNVPEHIDFCPEITKQYILTQSCLPEIQAQSIFKGQKVLWNVVVDTLHLDPDADVIEALHNTLRKYIDPCDANTILEHVHGNILHIYTANNLELTSCVFNTEKYPNYDPTIQGEQERYIQNVRFVIAFVI